MQPIKISKRTLTMSAFPGRRASVLAAGLLAAGLLGACGGKSSDGDEVDAAVDAEVPDAGPIECEIPDVTCDTGEHSEYGLCIPDAQEVFVPGGTFVMGAASGDASPEHSVTLSAYQMDRYEVTNARYEACVDSGCCLPPTYDGSYTGRQPYFGNVDYADYPVIFVTWEMARQYCEGQGKRLPTEAEWEFAARGDDGRVYPWGSDPPTSGMAQYDMPRDGDTAEVGAHIVGGSAFGLQDMAGNVWEWTADWFDADYYLSSPQTDPLGPDTGVAKVVRGGSFASENTKLYAFYRAAHLPSESFSTVGFRCAR